PGGVERRDERAGVDPVDLRERGGDRRVLVEQPRAVEPRARAPPQNPPPPPPQPRRHDGPARAAGRDQPGSRRRGERRPVTVAKAARAGGLARRRVATRRQRVGRVAQADRHQAPIELVAIAPAQHAERRRRRVRPRARRIAVEGGANRHRRTLLGPPIEPAAAGRTASSRPHVQTATPGFAPPGGIDTAARCIEIRGDDAAAATRATGHFAPRRKRMLATAITPYAQWLNPGDNSWQMTAATFVGLMSIPGLAVLYGGVMQKRWSVNSMMLTFIGFAVVMVAWALWAFKMGFGSPIHLFGAGAGSFFSNMVGNPQSILGHVGLQHQASIPLLVGFIPKLHFPEASLFYFQFVFAAITPLLMLGSVLGRINFKAWIPFVVLWITFVYAINAFLIWGGGYFGAHGALDYSGGYVIHLSAGVSGFVAAWVIGPRLKRDREIDAPNNLLMVATGAGLLWLGWNGFNGGARYFAGASASAAVVNTNLCTAVAMLAWIGWDLIYKDKPSLIGTVNGMITGLVGITPAAGYVNGYGAIVIGVVATTFVWMSIRYLSRVWPFRVVDDTLGVVYTHGIAGLCGGLLVGLLADPHGAVSVGASFLPGLLQPGGGATLLRWQAETALWVVLFSGAATFI